MKADIVHVSYISIAHAVLACVALGAAGSAREAEAGARAERDEADEESDSAPFTVVVEHGTGWRCSAALVSLRTALTSAQCARGPPSGGGGGGGGRGGELWARVPAPHAAPARSRVLRVALAAGADLDAGRAWGASAASRDLALLQLASALGGGVRPILLAASRADCEPPPGVTCQLVRALESRPAGTFLRIVELTLRPPRVCWAPAPRAAGDERALCLTGPDLCLSDQGAGVVCGGKLCGVLSGSRGAAGVAGVAGAGARCGAPHAAASVPRWRRFLHCAHTRGACGSDGECAQLCTERLLVEEQESEEAPHATLSAPAHAPDSIESPFALEPDERHEPPARTTLMEVSATDSVVVARSGPVRPTPTPTRSPPVPPAPAGATSTARHALEFEPNRADFTAGEYGDNAAEYAAPADEPAPPPSVAATPPPVTTAPPRPVAATRRSAVLARVSPASRHANASPPPSPQSALSPLMLLTNILCLCSSISVI